MSGWRSRTPSTRRSGTGSRTRRTGRRGSPPMEYRNSRGRSERTPRGEPGPGHFGRPASHHAGDDDHDAGVPNQHHHEAAGRRHRSAVQAASMIAGRACSDGYEIPGQTHRACEARKRGHHDDEDENSPHGSPTSSWELRRVSCQDQINRRSGRWPQCAGRGRPGDQLLAAYLQTFVYGI